VSFSPVSYIGRIPTMPSDSHVLLFTIDLTIEEQAGNLVLRILYQPRVATIDVGFHGDYKL
jgi:hypothetical protein